MKACRVASAIFAISAVLFVACEEPPRAAVAPSAPVASSAPASTNSERVAILDLPARMESHPCQQTVIMVVSGAAQTEGESLAVNDALVTITRSSPIEIRGTGTVVVATSEPACDEMPSPMKKVTRANDAPELTWADGKMHAHLDVGEKQGSVLYLGRLEGSAPVAEHVHEKSWEFVANTEASGTFTVNGVPQRIHARQVIAIPPNTKHSWTPDPGTKLVAVQVYDPPGPEQRFIELSAH